MNTRSEASPPVIDEGVVERVAAAILAAMDITDGLDSEAAETYARAALEAGCAGLVAEKWQPIETAPKDGTTVLLVEQAWGGDLVVTPGSYNEDYHGWWEHGSHPTDYADQPINNPSCWMPLPEPPRTALRGDREQGEG